MTYILLILFIVILYTFHKRYFPVYGVPCSNGVIELQESTSVVVDLRDYNVSAKKPLTGAINIPIAYLKRYYREIPNKKVHVIANDHLEKNMGVRLLRKKGFKVVSYTLNDCPCNQIK